MERERKFLIDSRPPGLARYPHDRIDQGYLAISSDSTEVRIRRKRDMHVLTVKRGSGGERREVERPITGEHFRALWPLTRGARLRKVRYRIPLGGFVIELDVYSGSLRGLITAEVEFQSVRQSRRFVPPAWFGRELTGIPGFGNASLARFGLPRGT